MFCGDTRDLIQHFGEVKPLSQILSPFERIYFDLSLTNPLTDLQIEL